MKPPEFVADVSTALVYIFGCSSRPLVLSFIRSTWAVSPKLGYKSKCCWTHVLRTTVNMYSHSHCLIEIQHPCRNLSYKANTRMNGVRLPWESWHQFVVVRHSYGLTDRKLSFQRSTSHGLHTVSRTTNRLTLCLLFTASPLMPGPGNKKKARKASAGKPQKQASLPVGPSITQNTEGNTATEPLAKSPHQEPANVYQDALSDATNQLYISENLPKVCALFQNALKSRVLTRLSLTSECITTQPRSLLPAHRTKLAFSLRWLRSSSRLYLCSR